MATNFPASLDALTNPISTDTLASPDHAGQHANANDAIEALQAKVGVDSSAVTTSLDYKVAQKIDKTLVDAKGDLIVASAADTVGRLAVGATNGHVLTVDSAQSLGVKWAAVAGMSELDAQTFASSTTYTVVAGAKLIVVEAIGAGGGGGGGLSNNGTTNTQGGAAGGGAPYVRTVLAASEVGGAGASVTVTIAAGGAGGASATIGSPGGVSRFGTQYFVGGRPGISGSNSGLGYHSGSEIFAVTLQGYGRGGIGTIVSAGGSGYKGLLGGGGGGGGGGATTTQFAGGAGGSSTADYTNLLTDTTNLWSIGSGGAGGGGTAGTAGGGAGGAGSSGAGGGGGGGSNASVGGVGGAGSIGGGGGGGGGANGGFTGGAGGAGGNAQIKIWVFG